MNIGYINNNRYISYIDIAPHFGYEAISLMYKSFTSNKLQDNPESSDTFINKAVLTVASYTRMIYYKYNRIPVCYHLPSQQQIK